MFGKEKLEPVFPIIEPLMIDTDKFKQRASSEILAGLIRGAPASITELVRALTSFA